MIFHDLMDLQNKLLEGKTMLDSRLCHKFLKKKIQQRVCTSGTCYP